MKYVLTTCLLFAGIASAQSPAPSFDYNAYQSETKSVGGGWLSMMMVRDGFGVARFCGWDLTKIVFDGVDSGMANSKDKTGDQVKQVLKDEIGSAAQRAIALTTNSGCKDNVQRAYLSFAEGIDRGMTTAVKFATDSVKNVQAQQAAAAHPQE